MKKTFTYTIVAGNKSCVNDCPICISKMTPDFGTDRKEPWFDEHVFRRKTRIALNHKAENVLITGKGEPTLFPAQVSKYLIEIGKVTDNYRREFDRIELQTEGSLLAKGGHYDAWLDTWKALGLELVAISIYHYYPEKNKGMFMPKSGKYFDLERLIKKLRSKGFQVRLSCCLMNHYIDTVEKVKRLIEYSEDNDVQELTVRELGKPDNPLDPVVATFVDQYKLSDNEFRAIGNFLEENGTYCDELPHGAKVYELNKMKVCISTCLTHDAGAEEIRQFIFFPPDRASTSWETIYGSAI